MLKLIFPFCQDHKNFFKPLNMLDFLKSLKLFIFKNDKFFMILSFFSVKKFQTRFPVLETFQNRKNNYLVLYK